MNLKILVDDIRWCLLGVYFIVSIVFDDYTKNRVCDVGIHLLMETNGTTNRIIIILLGNTCNTIK